MKPTKVISKTFMRLNERSLIKNSSVVFNNYRGIGKHTYIKNNLLNKVC